MKYGYYEKQTASSLEEKVAIVATSLLHSIAFLSPYSYTIF